MFYTDGAGKSREGERVRAAPFTGNRHYQVQARDPVVFGGVAATLALVGFAAAFIPARRVARVDPVVALNAE